MQQQQQQQNAQQNRAQVRKNVTPTTQNNMKPKTNVQPQLWYFCLKNMILCWLNNCNLQNIRIYNKFNLT